jgi:hypothetical protein
MCQALRSIEGSTFAWRKHRGETSRMAARAFVRRNPGVPQSGPLFYKKWLPPGYPQPGGWAWFMGSSAFPKIKVAPPAIILSQSNINHMYTMTVANSGKEQFFYGVGVRTCSCLYSFRIS